MGVITSQITSLTIVYSTIYSGTDQRKHQSSASLAFVRGIHRRLVNSPHKGSVARKMFPFDDVIISEYDQLIPYDLLYIASCEASHIKPAYCNLATCGSQSCMYHITANMLGLGSNLPVTLRRYIILYGSICMEICYMSGLESRDGIKTTGIWAK